MFDCQHRRPTAAAGQSGSGAGAGLPLCQRDGIRDASGTRRDTTAGLPPARPDFALTETGGKMHLNKQKNQSHTHKKFGFGLSRCIVVSHPPLPPSPHFRGWLSCPLCLFPGRGAELRPLRQSTTATFVLIFTFLTWLPPPSQHRHIETCPAINERGLVPLRVRRTLSCRHGEPGVSRCREYSTRTSTQRSALRFAPGYLPIHRQKMETKNKLIAPDPIQES